MLKNLFYESLFIIPYTLEISVKVILLANTFAIRYGFINEKFVEKVCQVFETKLQRIIKPKII